MAALAEAGSITIGTKFDQPLFGLKGPNGPEGFDVEIGKIIASELGIAEDNIDWKESVSANREPFIQNGEVDLVVATYTINDKRKEVVSFAGPYYMAGQSILVLADNEDIKSEDDLVGQPVCSVDRLDARREPRRARRRAGADRHLLELPRAAAQRRRRRRVDRQRDPRGPRGPERGRVQGRRRAVHRGALRHRRDARRHRLPHVDQRRPRGGRTRTAATKRRGTRRRAPCCRSSTRRQSTATDRSDASGRVARRPEASATLT